MASGGFRRGGRRGRKRGASARGSFGNTAFSPGRGVGRIGGAGSFGINLRLVDPGGIDIRPSEAAAKFKLDKPDRIVGTAAYRGVRRAAFKVKNEARTLILTNRNKRHKKPYRRTAKKAKYVSGAARYGKTTMSDAALKDYIYRRHLWHKRGSPAGQEPKPPFIPSKPGEPPKKGLGKLARAMFASPEKGVTPSLAARGAIDRVTFNAGPLKYGKGKNRAVGKRNRHTAPKLHERSGTGKSSSGKPAKYEKRPYMEPMKKKWANKKKLLDYIEEELDREGASEIRKFFVRRSLGVG